MDAEKIRALIRDDKTNGQIMSIGKRLTDSMFHIHEENTDILREMVCTAFSIGATSEDSERDAICVDAHRHNHQGSILNGMALIAFTVGLITFVSLERKMHNLLKTGDFETFMEALQKEVDNEN